MLTTELAFLLLVCPIFIASSQVKAFEFKPRIIGGEFSEPNQFKYMVSLRDVKRFDSGRVDYNHFCGGALISANFVISAAHCLALGEPKKRSNIRIVVGANHFWRDGVIYKVKKIIIHKDFDVIFHKNDVSLLQTTIPVELGESVQPVPIGKQPVKAGAYGIFSGFGKTENRLTPFTLKYIKLRVISNDECIERHSFVDQFLIHNSSLCTFVGNGAGTFEGDSGGSLVINNNLAGVLSWGDLGYKVEPEQFTRISEFTDWIEEKTGIKTI